MSTTETLYTLKQPARALFLTIFEAKQFMKDGKPKGDAKFSATIAIPEMSPELAEIKQVMVNAAKAKWPTRDLKELKWPLASGEKKIAKATAKGSTKDLSIYKGQAVITARSKYAPALSVLNNGKIISLESDALKAQWKSKFYNGCYVAACFNFVPYEGDMGDDGVTAYLQSILWIKDGERIGGRDQTEVFKNYAGKATDEDPFAGSEPDNDEIPF